MTTESPISYLPKQMILIGDTVSGLEIEWVKCGSAFAARHPLLINISWLDLLYQRMSGHKIIRIDGVDFRVDLPQIGQRKEVFQESHWARFYLESIKAGGGVLWQTDKKICFWGREPYGKSTTRCSVGGADLFHWHSEKKECRSDTIGWRPWLEPLLPAPQDILGVPVSVSTSHCLVSGIVVGFSEYDLVLKRRRGIDQAYSDIPGCTRRLDGDQVVIARSTIQWVVRRWGETNSVEQTGSGRQSVTPRLKPGA